MAIRSFKMSPECLLWAWHCSRSWDDLVKKIAVVFLLTEFQRGDREHLNSWAWGRGEAP